MCDKNVKQITEIAEKMQFDNIGVADVGKIMFAPELAAMCEMNTCGNYGRCYTCPPYVGKTEELIKTAKTYKVAVVVQKIYALTDSFDYEGMQTGQLKFNELFNRLVENCRKTDIEFLPLGAGGCRLCERCGVLDNIACRYPDKAYSSLEAYAIQVSQLAKICSMNYINGKNTVTYFGTIFVK